MALFSGWLGAGMIVAYLCKHHTFLIGVRLLPYGCFANGWTICFPEQVTAIQPPLLALPVSVVSEAGAWA